MATQNDTFGTIPTFKSERTRTAWWGRKLRLESGMTKYQYDRLLDAVRGKTALYNELSGTKYNAAQVMYNAWKYGSALTEPQKAILSLPSVAHGHKAGESKTRSTATSAKTVERARTSAEADFLRIMYPAYEGEHTAPDGTVIYTGSKTRSEHGVLNTGGRIPFWEVYESVRDHKAASNGHTYTVEEAWQIAREYKQLARTTGESSGGQFMY